MIFFLVSKQLEKEGMRMRQKKAAISLLELKGNKEALTEEISELCKSFDAASFAKEKNVFKCNC